MIFNTDDTLICEFYNSNWKIILIRGVYFYAPTFSSKLSSLSQVIFDWSLEKDLCWGH